MDESTPSITQADSKPCVLCAEPIRVAAKICPFCGSGQSKWSKPLRIPGVASVTGNKKKDTNMEPAAEMKDCAWCAEPIRAAARVCPHCRRMQPTLLRRTRIEGRVTMVFAVAFFAWFAITIRNVVGPGESFEKYRRQIAVLSSEHHFSQATNGNFISVIGELRNNSPLGWKDIELEAQFYDKSGHLIDVRSEGTYSKVIGPGQTHAFRLRGPADKPESAYASHKVFVRSARDAKTFR